MGKQAFLGKYYFRFFIQGGSNFQFMSSFKNAPSLRIMFFKIVTYIIEFKNLKVQEFFLLNDYKILTTKQAHSGNTIKGIFLYIDILSLKLSWIDVHMQEVDGRVTLNLLPIDKKVILSMRFQGPGTLSEISINGFYSLRPKLSTKSYFMKQKCYLQMGIVIYKSTAMSLST